MGKEGRNSPYLISLLVLTLLLSSALFSGQASGAPRQATDQEISDAIEDEFRKGQAIPVNRIVIETTSGIVTLTGQVDNILASISADFLAERPQRQISLEEIVATVCRKYVIQEKELAIPGRYRHNSEARGMAAWLILETGQGTIAELARLTGRDATTLSAVAKNLRAKAKTDTVLSNRMEQLMGELGLNALMQA